MTRTTSLVTYQVRDGRKWTTVATLNAEAVKRTQKVLKARHRVAGKHYRFTVRKGK